MSQDTTAALARLPSADLALATIAERARDYAGQAKAANTLRAYRADWDDFTTWCAHHGLVTLPAAPETVAVYLTHLAELGRKPATLGRRLSAISQAHQLAGHASPTKSAIVKETHRGIRRALGTRQEGKAPAVTADIRRMVDALPGGLLGIRDRALLLVGFAGAFRRSELVGLDLQDVKETADGLVITLRRSKTDQEGRGQQIGIPYGSTPTTCPVRALKAWRKSAKIQDGSLFRPVDRHGNLKPGRLSDKAVALVVKRSAAAAGLDAASYSGHSLRAGLATSAAAAGVSERAIMAQTGHKSVTMVRRYIRDGSLFRENAAAGVGL